MKVDPNTKPIVSWFSDEIAEDDTEFEWESMLEYLDEILKQVNPEGYWHCSVENFGWRKQSGCAYLKFNTAQKMISKVLPKCECSFRVFKEDKILKIQNYHHDSPVGNEWYKLVPITFEQYET